MILLLRYIREHRPAVTLAALLLLSLISLASGTQATLIHRGIQRAVAVTSYPFLAGKGAIEDSVDYVLELIFDYDLRRRENAVLKEEVIAMKSALLRHGEVDAENRRLRRMLNFQRATPRLTLEPVRVIQSSKGVLTIDRGSVHGIRESMGVVAEDGVVGVVTEVGDFTSSVATLHHNKCKIGAMVLRNRVRAYDGVIHASGALSRICTLEYVDLKDDVRKGDEVVTSPESVFPAGWPIGRISAPPSGTGSLWRWAEVEPFVDPYRLDEVFVIRKAEADASELAGPLPEPWNLSHAPAVPDNRPIQERYAP